MKKPTLYPYQKEYFDKVLERFKEISNILLVLPTGGGKTTVFGTLIDSWFKYDKKCMVVVHRVELVEQVVENLKNFGISAGIIADGFARDYSLKIQVGMVQSIPDNLPMKFDYIVIDECHHSVASSYQKLWTLFPEAKILGVTATPIRTDGKGFEELYQEMINLYDMPYLVKEGYLVKPKHYFCCSLVEEIPIVDGDYDVLKQSKIMRQQNHISDVLDSYLRYTPGKRAVVFAVDVDHSKTLRDKFLAVGISAEHIDGALDSKERKKIIARFRAGQTMVLCNYNIISEGFDVPAIETVILARRSKSLSWYLQSIGRALRPDRKSGKEFGYVLDCASAYLDHGHAGISYRWSIEGSQELIKESILATKMFKEKKNGSIEPILPPEEILGVEMVALSHEYDIMCTNLEVCLHKAEDSRQPLTEGILYYNDKLLLEGRNWSEIEINYCVKRTGLPQEHIMNLLTAA